MKIIIAKNIVGLSLFIIMTIIWINIVITLKMCTNHGWLIFLLHRMWTLLYVCILSDQILSSIWMIPNCCMFDALCWCSFYKSLLAFPKSWYCPSQTDNLARLSEGSSIFELSSHLISYEFEIDFAIVY